MSYAKHRRAIEKMYTDNCTVYRYGKTKDPITGETIQGPVAICENQPCRISKRALATNSQSDAANSIAYETKLFIAPELEIRQGDMLLVSRGGVERKYTAGEPFLYPTHQEASIQRKEWA